MKYDYLDWAQACRTDTFNMLAVDNKVKVFVALALTKISICLFLRRLAQFDRLKRLLHGLIALIILTHVPLFLLIVLQCNPVDKYWHTEVPGSCFRKKTVEKIIIAQGVKLYGVHWADEIIDFLFPVFSILSDFVCAAFPAILL